MKLNERVLEALAAMVCGDNEQFPYRSSSYITRFFERCGLPFVHDGSTRKWWVEERLAELNLGVCQQHDLPADDLLCVISELFEPDDFDMQNKRGTRQVTIEGAVAELNRTLKRQSGRTPPQHWAMLRAQYRNGSGFHFNIPANTPAVERRDGAAGETKLILGLRE